MPLKEGAVSRHPSLRSALKVAREEALSELGAEWGADGDELWEWLVEAPDALAGRSVHDAIVAMGWSEARTRKLFGRVAEEGRIYSTIDSDHFAVRVAPVSPQRIPPHQLVCTRLARAMMRPGPMWCELTGPIC